MGISETIAMNHRLTILTTGAAALATAATIVLAGCGSSAAFPPPFPVPSSTAAPNDLSASPLTALAGTINAKGINCSDFSLDKPSDIDPGAVAEGHCGFPNVIEIAALADRQSLQPLVTTLRNFSNCDPTTLTNVYIDGGAWVIYSLDDATTAQIAKALGMSTSQVC